MDDMADVATEVFHLWPGCMWWGGGHLHICTVPPTLGLRAKEGFFNCAYSCIKSHLEILTSLLVNTYTFPYPCGVSLIAFIKLF